MKVSAITEEPVEESFKRNDFIRFSNKVMSNPETPAPVEQPQAASKKSAKMGIENLQEFTVFPKQVIDGRTIITA